MDHLREKVKERKGDQRAKESRGGECEEEMWREEKERK